MDLDSALNNVDYSHRTMSLLDVTLLWSGINTCLPSLMLGAVLMPALSVPSALLVLALGSLFLSCIIYLTGLPGVKHGISSPLLIRRIIGYPLGTAVPAAAVIISMAGWSAVLLAAGGEALAGIMSWSGPEAVVVLAGFSAGMAAFLGEKGVRWTNRVSIPVLTVLFIGMGYILFSQQPVVKVLKTTGNCSFGMVHGFDLIVGGTIAGAFVSSDLARFAVNRRALLGGVMLGNIPVNVLLGFLGIACYTVSGSWNPLNIAEIKEMGFPSAVMVILTVITTIQASIYSGGLAFANIMPRLERRPATMIVCIMALFLALCGIIRHFEGWLMLLNRLFVPMVGVMTAAVLWPSGEQRKQSIDWPALGGIAGGIIVSIPDTPVPQTVLALVISAAVYCLLRVAQGRS